MFVLDARTAGVPESTTKVLTIFFVSSLANNNHRWKDKRLFMDVTEIFNRVDEERRARTRKLTFLGIVGFWTAYKVVYAALMTLLTEAGRKAMAKVLREASHSPMYHMF